MKVEIYRMATDYDAPRKSEDDSESIEALKTGNIFHASWVVSTHRLHIETCQHVCRCNTEALRNGPT